MGIYYGLVYYPENEKESINKIRQKYDPTFNIIDPHLTIMSPVPFEVGKLRIINHINHILKNRHPIKIQFCDFKKSWDHWLFLTIKEGESEIKELFMEIYSGILLKYHRKDIEFIPHISLGLFVKNYKQYNLKNPKKLIFDSETFNDALLEAKSIIRKFNCTIDNLDLVEMRSNLKRIKSIKKFIIK